MDEDGWWLLLGFGGQALFMGRFVLQWLASERRRRSVIPVSFWYLSIAGALVLLGYALHRRDPVFAAGQGLGLAVYLRNLQLLRAARARRPGAREPRLIRARTADSAGSGNTTPGSDRRSRPGTGCGPKIRP